MSHYCGLIITTTFPTDEVLGKILEPYNEDRFYEQLDEGKDPVRPCFLWDYWQVGGRYAGNFKLSTDDKEKYGWDFYLREPRTGRLFRSFLLENMKRYVETSTGIFRLWREEDYFSSMGYRDGYLYVDGAEICDIKNYSETECFLFIDQNGNARARECWDGEEWKNNFSFDEELKQALENSTDCFGCIVDFHN